MFKDENEFEVALCKELSEHGWSPNVLYNPTVEDLKENWYQNLFRLNKKELNNVPLSESEKIKVFQALMVAKNPVEMNELINGGSILFTRDADSPDIRHRGKTVYLYLYDRDAIFGGDSGYQIARQTIFVPSNIKEKDRRGDVTLLFNGLPLIHIELKSEKVDIEEAESQIEKYSSEGIFTGFMSTVQVFVAMNPNDMVYFANVGNDALFDRKYYFHWANRKNEQINYWKDVVREFFFIPMAHQLIGFFTVPDKSDYILKVMRSYQIHAVMEIKNKVALRHMDVSEYRGGYIWHTTGSGKTMTSFKAAQVIQPEVDKVVFITDRIELGSQSTEAYQSYVVKYKDKVAEAKSASSLIALLKNTQNNAVKLITVSMQKINRLSLDDLSKYDYDLRKINQQDIVFIIDEAHRSVYGEMFKTLREKFPKSMIFGFTGTPIFEFNKKTLSSKYNKARTSIQSDAIKIQTEDVFGEELHSYTIADGIRDNSVLPFDIDGAKVIDDYDMRVKVALSVSGIGSSDMIDGADEDARNVYYEYLNDLDKHPMAGYYDSNNHYIKGIEDEVPRENYDNDEYRKAVVKDMMAQWGNRTQNGKFHSIFACSSIREACLYYKLIREEKPFLRITCLFDENENSNTEWRLDGKMKHEVVEEMLDNYNELYGTNFSFRTYDEYKTDVRLRLAHKKPYNNIGRDGHQKDMLNIVIVVDQLLTGYDAKWVNTLYLDKVLEAEHIIQAFSRTNRLCGPAKQYGYIRYYRKTATMERNIEEALNAYSKHNPSVFKVNKLRENITEMNNEIIAVRNVFTSLGINDFSHLPEDKNDQWNFIRHFEVFAKRLEAATMQGFSWNNKCGYQGTEEEYRIFLVRYKDFADSADSGRTKADPRVPLDVTYGNFGASNILANNRFFDNILKRVYAAKQDNDNEAEDKLKQELHSSYANRSATDQKYLAMILHDIDESDFVLDENKSLEEYIQDYKMNTQSSVYKDFSEFIGIAPDVLKEHIRQIPLGNVKESHTGQHLAILKDMASPDNVRGLLLHVNKKEPKPYEIRMAIDSILMGFCHYMDRVERNLETEPFNPSAYIK